MQTLWNNAMDSDFVKFLLDVANAFVKVADSAGLIPTALAAALSFKTFKNKDGLFDFSQIFKFDENASSIKEGFSFNKNSTVGKVGTSIGNIFNKIGKQATSVASDVNDAMNSAGESIETVGDYVVEADGQLSMFNNTEAASATAMRGQAAAANGAATGLKSLGIGAKVAGVGVKLLNAALSMFGAIVISIAISKLIEQLYKMANASEETAQRASEAISNYNDAQKTLESQKKTVDELASSYQKLSSGVNTSNNKNIGLTTESYADYLDVCNQIAEMFPQLISGYDSEGNAILTLKGKVEELTKAYEDSARAAASQFLTKDNKKDIWDTYNNTMNEDAKKKWYGTWKPTGSASEQQEILDFFDKLNAEQFSALLEVSDEINSYFASTEDRQPFFDVLSELGYSGEYMSNGKLTNLLNDMDIDFEGISKQIEDGDITLTDGINKLKSNISVALSNVNSTISSALGDIKQTVSAKLLWDDEYQKLDSDTKSLVNTIVNNLDADMISQMGANSIDDVVTKIMSSLKQADQDVVNGIFDVQDDITKAMADGDRAAFISAKNDFNKLIPDDWKDKVTGEIIIDEDADAVTQYLQKLAQQIQEQSKNYEVKLQMQTEFESPTKVSELLTKYTGEYKDEIEKAFNDLNLGENATMEDVYEKIGNVLAGDDGKFTADEFETAYQDLINGDMSNWSEEQQAAIKALDAVMKMYGTDIDTVKAKLMELGFVLPDPEDVDSFNLSSESTQDKVTQFQDDIAAIKEAWNSLNDKEMTKSDFIELAMDLPEIMNGVNLGDDNWMVQAKKNLEELNATKIDNFITQLEQMRDAMEVKGEDTSVVNSFINYANQLKTLPLLEIKANPDTVSALTSAYENYKTVLAEANEILYDGQEVSEDYYSSLKDYIDDVEALDSCFDKNNKNIVTNAKKLKQLITQQKNQTKSTVSMAKAQAQLQYKQLLQELAALTNGTNQLDAAQIEQVNTLQEQINTVQAAINDYKLLELELSNATKAYEEYQKAKEKESNTDYEPTTLEMIESIMNGFDTGEVGTESFLAAAKGLLSESITGTLTTAEQLDAVWAMMTSGNMSKFFTYTDEEFEITLGNLKNFVAEAQKSGLMWGESFEEFGVASGVTLEQFAEGMGLSTDATMAFLDMLSDYTIGGEKLWGDLADFKWAGEFDEATDQLNDLLQKRAELQKSGDYDGSLEEQIIAKQNEVNAKYDEAITHVEKWQAAVNMANATNPNSGITFSDSELVEIQRKFNEIFGTEYSLKIENGKLVATREQLDEINTKKQEVGKPVESEINISYQAALDKIEEIKAKIAEVQSMTDQQVSVKYGTDKQTLLSDLNKDLTTAQENAKELEVTYGLTPSEESDTILDKLDDLEVNGVNTTINADTTQATQDVDKFKQNAAEPVTTTITVNTVQGTTTVESTGDNGVTVNFKETGYQDVVNKISYITTQTKVPIDQAVDVSDNDTVEDVTGELTELRTDCETVIDQAVDVSDNYSIGVVSDKLTDLKTQLDNLPTSKTITINVQQNGSIPSGATKALGNANAMGSSHAGLPKNERNSIVGEVGKELIVDPYKGIYYTVGENGTEMVNLPKGAIIYNHKQTEELLKNGHTSRGKLTSPLAFAEGNAFAQTYTKHYNWSGTQNTADSFTAAADSVSSAADSLSSAADDISDATDEFEETFDWIEIRLEEIDKKLSLLDARIENATSVAEKNSIIDQAIADNQAKLVTLTQGYQKYSDYATELLAKIPEEYRDAAKNGAIEITEFVGDANEETVNSIDKYREWVQKADDALQSIEETTKSIRDYTIQKFNNIYDFGEAKTSIEDKQTEKLQNKVDYIETSGYIADPAYYRAMMENSGKKIEYWTPVLAQLQKELDDAVTSGKIEVGDLDWWEMVGQLYDVQSEIDNATLELEEFQNSINDLYWDNFDELINRLDYINDETQNLIDLMESSGDLFVTPEGKTNKGGTIKYWTAEDVQWTDKGIATLGLYAQQMETAEFKAKKYSEAIQDLTKDYNDGKYSESEYLEKLNELKNAQYESIQAYYKAQDAIVELNKTRIETVKDGIQKEIDAYSELIEKKKEELSLQKEAHDFQKQVAEKQKDIADIQKKLAAMAGDNSAATNAERKKLQEELYNANTELEELYYQHSMEKQQDALDDELERFQDEKDAEIDELDAYLDDVEAMVADSLKLVQDNATGVLNTLTATAEEYGLTISDTIITPWQNGALAISDYQSVFNTAMSSTTDQLKALEQSWQAVIDKMQEYAAADIDRINKENASYVSATKPVEEPVSEPEPEPEQPAEPTLDDTTKRKVAAAIWRGTLGWGSNPEREQRLTEVFGANNGIQALVNQGVGMNDGGSDVNNYSYTLMRKKFKGYAKGSKKIDKDQLALIDELGEELVLNAGNNGKLQFISKGSGIVPASLTERLMEWGELDPSKVLEQSKPVIGADTITNNEFNIDMSFGSLVHVDTVNQDTLPDLQKLVRSEFDNCMKGLNSALKRYRR